MAGPGESRPGVKLFKKHKIVFLLMTVVIALPLLSGCGMFKGWFGTSGDEIEVPPQQLAEEGMQALQAERYREAAQKFQDLRDRYPYSRYAILAELKMADANYLAENYIEAADAYAQFEQMHPNNEAVPYVIYQQGMSYFKQIPSYDRDQSATVKAIQTFSRLRQTFPDSQFSPMAEARLAEAKKNLAAHEFYIGEFYFRNGQYEAALGRFVSLLKSYPDAGYHDQAMNYIILSRQKLSAEEGRTEEKEETAETEARKDGQIDKALRSPEGGDTR